jgi:ATP-binding cassette, subfamily B, bacterial HlyB/CyaB
LKHLDHTVDRTGFVWALGSLCQLHKIPFDANLLLQQITPPYNIAGLLNAGQQLGLKIKAQSTAVTDLTSLPLPSIALMQAQTSEDKTSSESAPTHQPIDRIEPTFTDSDAVSIESIPNNPAPARPTFSLVLILRADQDRVLCIGSGEQNPSLLPVADFAAQYTGQVILAGVERTAAVTEDAIGPADVSAKPAFGFRWFVPELLKHKSIWRDVLLASLAIQLMALATPLFTQVIIDKVIVHHTMSTLTVIGIALAVFMLFTAVMTWVRQYLVIHTGNRVDAVLGTQVFSHLFKLPTRYFEQRPTGVVVARMHAIEEIREFITGAAVTLILDFPFLLIFLGIMFYFSVPLTLLSLCLLAVIVGLSFIVAPMFRARLNQQFLLGARNQAFLTEYVSGMETVKSLQMEPQLNSKYGNYMADYLQAGFKTKVLGNTYNTIANTLEQGMTLAILCVGAYLLVNCCRSRRSDFKIGGRSATI